MYCQANEPNGQNDTFTCGRRHLVQFLVQSPKSHGAVAACQELLDTALAETLQRRKRQL